VKSTVAILAATMFIGDRTTASPSLAGAAAVVHTQKSHTHTCLPQSLSH